MTADEYKTYYQKGYKTDITNIDIAGDHIAFTYEDGKRPALTTSISAITFRTGLPVPRRPCIALKR